MTHTLHRVGEREDLERDFPILAHYAKGYNDIGSEDRLRKISEIFMKHTNLNYGCAVVGNRHSTDVDVIMEKIKVGAHAVFNNMEDLTACMKELKEADTGISIVVSGCFDLVEDCCKKAGIDWHLTEYSLGVHGKTDRLPSGPHLEIITMCGHSMVAKPHIDHMVKQIKKGKISYEDAGKELAKPCLCGIFNPERAAQVLKKMVEATED